MLDKGDLITLSNDKEYVVINQIHMDGKIYLYLIAKDGISSILICELKEDNLIIVKDAELFQKLVVKFNKIGKKSDD